METSLEFLVNKVFGKNGLILYAEVIEQAKAMHKSETIRFVETMPAYIDIGKEGGFYVKYNAEEHYNKTFNNGTHIN
jgi:hypothetical protein